MRRWRHLTRRNRSTAHAGGLILGLGVAAAQAGVFPVTTTQDSGPGSLRQSVLDAVAQGGGSITFSNISGSIQLASPLPQLSGSIEVLGPGTNVLAISGGDQFRLFSVAPGATALLAGLTIADGRLTNGEPGAGILNAGALTISNCVVSNHQNVGGRGGGVWNSGHLTIFSSLIVSNASLGADRGESSDLNHAFGGALHVSGGQVRIVASELSNNRATAGSAWHEGASAGGGALYLTNGTVSLEGCRVAYNSAHGGPGAGAIQQSWPGGLGGGGGVFVAGGSLTMRDCHVTGNSARGGDGGSGYQASSEGGYGLGAGMHVAKGLVDITSTTFSANVCAGGTGSPGGRGGGGGLFAGGGTATVLNSTFSGNSGLGGDGSGPGGEGLGGGVLADGAILSIHSSTLTLNTAVGGERRDLILRRGVGRGGGLCVTRSTPSLRTSILAENSADEGPDGSGSALSEGHNLVGRDAGLSLGGNVTNDLRNVAAHLGLLQDNGGSTPTHALLTNSPAVDAGPTEGTPSIDQRDVSRPQGRTADVGAFELRLAQGDPSLTVTVSPRRVILVGTDVSVSVEGNGDPTAGVQWMHNDLPIPGATGTVLHLQNVRLGDAGSYWVRGPGGAASSEAILEVRPFLIEPAFDWVVSSDGSSGYPHIERVAMDPLGSPCAVGSFFYRIQVGGLVLTNSLGSSIYVLKLNRAGEVLWLRRLTISGQARPVGISPDAAGNLYVAGDFSAAASASRDLFVAKLSPGGSVLWQRTVGGNSHDQAGGIATDSAGNCVVTGFFYTNTVLGPFSLQTAGASDIFVVKYGADGSVQWVRQAGGTHEDYGDHVAMDDSGGCYVTGSFSGNATFGPEVVLTSTNQNTPFVASYDAAGNLRWARKPIQFDGRAFIHAVTADRSNHLYVAGGFSGSVIIGTNSFTSLGGYSTLLAKFDSGGSVQWTQAVRSTGSAVWTAVALDNDGAVCVAGNFYGDFGPSGSPVDLGAGLTSRGSWDMMLAKFGPDGRLRWLTAGGGGGSDFASGVAVSAFGEVFVGGSYQRLATFGGFAVQGSPDDSSIFLTRVALHPRLGAPRVDPVGTPNRLDFWLEGEADVRYLIEHSEDLSSWLEVLTVTNSAGLSEVMVPTGTPPGIGFYRARLVR